MKKMIGILLTAAMCLIAVFPAFAAEKMDEVSEDVISKIQEDISAEKVQGWTENSSAVLNYEYAMPVYCYYLVRNGETVSNYGNHGSVDYTGYSLKNAHWDVYHNLTYKYKDNYTVTATSSEQNVTDGMKFTGKYRLKYKSTGKYADNAEIYIIFSYRLCLSRRQGLSVSLFPFL